MDWFYRSSNTKSLGELSSLVNDVILAPDFDPSHFTGFNTAQEHARMDHHRDPIILFIIDDTWIKGTVEIPLPCDGVKQ